MAALTEVPRNGGINDSSRAVYGFVFYLVTHTLLGICICLPLFIQYLRQYFIWSGL